MQEAVKGTNWIVTNLSAGLNGSLRAFSTAAILGVLATAGTASAEAPVPAPATKPDQLIVRTWGGPWRSTYESGAAASFTAKTGIPVVFDTTDFNEIQVKVGQAVSAGRRAPVDVVLTIEAMAYTAQVQGVSAPLDPHLMTNSADLSSVARPDGATNYVNVSTYSQPVVYDPDQVELPASISWEEIFDEKYAGKLFVTNTFSSLLFPVAKMMGIDYRTDDLGPVFAKIATLKGNIGAAGDEEEFIAGIEAGQISLGVTLAATAIEIGGLKWTVPSEGAVVSSESFYVAAGLPEDVSYWAQVFIDEALSAENQAALAAGIGESPVNLKAAIPDFMQGDPAFPVTEADIAAYGIVVPVEVEARNRDAWQAAYTAAIQN